MTEQIRSTVNAAPPEALGAFLHIVLNGWAVEHKTNEDRTWRLIIAEKKSEFMTERVRLLEQYEGEPDTWLFHGWPEYASSAAFTPSLGETLRDLGKGYILTLTTHPNGWHARVLQYGNTVASVVSARMAGAAARAVTLALWPDAPPEARALLTPEA